MTPEHSRKTPALKGCPNGALSELVQTVGGVITYRERRVSILAIRPPASPWQCDRDRLQDRRGGRCGAHACVAARATGRVPVKMFRARKMDQAAAARVRADHRYSY